MLTDCYKDSHTYETDTTYEYRWESLRIPCNVTKFTFKVKANNDAHIALSAADETLTNFYEIGKSLELKDKIHSIMRYMKRTP